MRVFCCCRSTKVTGDAAEKFADEMPNLRAVRR
jgi:hypothetical protein